LFDQLYTFIDLTFEQLFWEIWNANNMQLPDDSDVDLTFMFEMITHRLHIVLHYDEEKISLHGVR
jgi:hypothetical protein